MTTCLKYNKLTEKHLWQFNGLNEFDALSFSAELGHSEITKLLLKYGAERNLLKAQTSEDNYNTCKAILGCYDKLEPNMTLVDCVENAKVVDENHML